MSRNDIGRIDWTWNACESCAKYEECDGDCADTVVVDSYLRCRDYEPKEADE